MYPKKKCYQLHLIILLTGIFCSQLATSQDKKLNDLPAGPDSVRIQLKIPALGVALKQGRRIMYQGALGYANRDKNFKATTRTTFRVASITKTFTTTPVMQLIQAGKLSLDAKTIDFGVNLGNPDITTRHLLAHTSEGIPGSYFQYNG